MAHRLREGLAFCFIDGKPVFLDIIGDRYFMLEGSLAAAFKAFVACERLPKRSHDALVRARILDARSVEPATLKPPQLSAPRKSVLEDAPARGANVLFAAAETAWLLMRAKRRRKRGFAYSMEHLQAKKCAGSERADLPEMDVAAFAAGFHEARRLLPAAPNCLTDSLALFDYLHRRGARADFVIGVRLEPHGAHCWMQTKNILLNDIADRAASFTPILVI